MNVVGKYRHSFPSYILKQCREVTSNCHDTDNGYVDIVFFNELGKLVGAARVRYDSFKLIKCEPKFCVYIDSFEVCECERGKGNELLS